MEELPSNARDAMDIVLDWIKAAADVSFRHTGGKKCLKEFDDGNWEQFKGVYSGSFWRVSRDNLRRAATLHGILTTIYTLEKDPKATEADFESFVKAGLQVRDICKTHLEALLKSRQVDLDPDQNGTIRGQWCSWPSR